MISNELVKKEGYGYRSFISDVTQARGGKWVLFISDHLIGRPVDKFGLFYGTKFIPSEQDFKAAHRLTVFAQFHRNLKLQHFCKTLEGSARYCKILHVVPELLTFILTLNSSNASLA